MPVPQGESPTRLPFTPHLRAGLLILAGVGLVVVAATYWRDAPLAIAGAALAASAAVYLAIAQLVLKPIEARHEAIDAVRAEFATMALEDPLTGLPNKRAFEERVDAELRRAKREYYPVALLALDLDRFKNINDTWGHGVGDEALVMLARKIEAELRAGDFCGRMGGDEFMICLARADSQSAGKVLTRLRASLVGARVGPDRHQITFSAGISEFPHHSTVRGELVKMADAALYWGKANGRDRWAVYTPEAGDALSREEAAAGIRRRGLINTLQALAKGVDGKNRFTQHHSEQVATYAVALAERLSLPDERISAIRQAGLLHDVGKIGVNEEIVVKEAALSVGEADELKRHSLLGRDMLLGAGLFDQAKWVYHLHERYDGGGYPDALAGAYIPIESRILHVADALEHMTRSHPYRRHRPLNEALLELRYNAGTKLDPQLVEFMIELVEAGVVKIPGHEPTPGPRPHSSGAQTRMRGTRTPMCPQAF